MIDASNLLRKKRPSTHQGLLDLFAFKAYPGVFDLIKKVLKVLFESNKKIFDQILSEKK